MTRPIPLEVQESSKDLFSRSRSLRAIQNFFPDLSLSVLSRYRKKFFGNSKQTAPRVCNAFYWTDRPTELLPHQTEAQVQGDGSVVVFWGMITAEGPSYGSTITEGTVNSEVYAGILELSLQDTMAYYGLARKPLDSSKTTQDHILPVLLRDGSDTTGTLWILF
ncbi:hypothetical protein INT46_010377 [Mucor plumbeus]|uniref:Uncharacterized protein n=1 Tax=Mucor plumbeus TaxID=97098 RepID=A0A8H7R242_9FUNG|nr:hypothetical protein INT46_010377 [Mucor plumbeus]